MNSNFVHLLCQFYQEKKRDLPWRHTKDPYPIWLSEIMLQQTRVEAVKVYYARFLKALPTIQALADCPEDQLLKLWEGLGYYNRVRNLQKAARIIVEEYHGQFPSTYEEILALPGIGEYTAGAIASIAFGQKVPAVDGNVLRVMARIQNSPENILDTAFKKRIRTELLSIVAKADCPGDFNQALIELGAIICIPNGAPLCDACPVNELCEAHLKHTTDHIPLRIKKGRRTIDQRTILLIRNGTETAISKRPAKGLLAGLYEFPSLNGHVAEKDAISAVEERGLTALHIRRLPPAKHLFSHVTWEMIGYEIRIAPETEHMHAPEDQAEWIFAEQGELKEAYALPSAFQAYAQFLSVQIGKRGLDEDAGHDL